MKTTNNSDNKENNTAVATTKTFELTPMEFENVGSALKENLGGQGITPFDFDRLSFPAGGATHWTVYDSLSGEECAKKEITGVVFHQGTSRSYWASDFAGAGILPDCSSNDGIAGHGSPGGRCDECPHNRFGSRGRGKACKESRELYILQEENNFPIVISVPPSSIKVFHDLCVHLGVLGIRLHEAAVRFALTVDKNADGIKFSKLNAKFLYKLTPAAKENMKKLRDSFVAAFVSNKSKDGTDAKITSPAMQNQLPSEKTYTDDVPF